MTINMDDSHLVSIAQIREFLKTSALVNFKGVSRQEKYQWVENTLNRFGYFKLKRKDKGIVRNYLVQMTGFSLAQAGRLIERKWRTGKILVSSTKRNSFPTTYTPEDIALLVATDNAHGRLSGKATQEILVREFEKFSKSGYERLSKISLAHIYNLREKKQYTSASLTYTKTQSTQVKIGERRKPDNEGKPGYIRIDSVHQGDLNGKKGVYHINVVDEVIQWEVVGCVEKISEQYLEVLLEDLLLQFPYKIINFHSDNGSEYINGTVAALLNKLVIRQTKSRSGRCNDNALVECKNGAVIRKHMGRSHICQKNARPINEFYKKYFNVYLNYHRPSAYPTVTFEANGKRKKVYDSCMIPYEKLKSLENAAQYLRPGITFEILDAIAYAKSDNEYAALMQEKKQELFKNLTK
jgi:transposase InsO family protein